MTRPIPHPDDGATPAEDLQAITAAVNRWARLPGDTMKPRSTEEFRKQYAYLRAHAVERGFAAASFRAEVERRAATLHGDVTPEQWCNVARGVAAWCDAVLSVEKLRREAAERKTAAYAKGPVALIPLIVKDSGWKGAQVGRCIADYRRSITFSRDLTASELTEIAGWLHTVDCPGWTGIIPQGSGAEWSFTTTHDSSD